MKRSRRWHDKRMMAVCLLSCLALAQSMAHAAEPSANGAGQRWSVSRIPPPDDAQSTRPALQPDPTSPNDRLAPSDVVQRRTQHAMQLAARGAVYAAEEEFLRTLQLMAHRCDERAGDQRHSSALAAGIVALREADAFAVALGDPSASGNVRALIAAHSTPVFQKSDPNEIPALRALQMYYDYAQAQIQFAVERDPGASEVFFGLAKISMVQAGSEDETSAVAQAIAYLQLALEVDQTNYRAANELGVLLARCGRLEQAKRVFQQGLLTRPEPETLLNLSKVLDRLGEPQQAARVRQQYEIALRRRSESSSDERAAAIRWVDKTTFTDGHNEAELISGSSPTVRPANLERTDVTAASTAPESPLDKLKSLFRLGRSDTEPAKQPQQASRTREYQTRTR